MREWYTQYETITSYTGNNTEVIVPSSINSRQIDTIGDYAFSPEKYKLKPGHVECRRNIKKIIISEGIKGINDHAFDGCLNLESISIPDSLRYIGAYAFKDCSSLKTFDFRSSRGGAGMFEGCEALETVTSLKATSTDMFCGCLSLKNIVLPDDLRVLSCGTFLHCESLKSIDIPSSVKEIGNNCFCECKSLTDVHIPDGVTEIESSLFRRCENLVNVRLPANLKTIHQWAFARCSSLEVIDIPENVEKFRSDVFRDCNSLKRVIIRGAQTMIEDDHRYNRIRSGKQIIEYIPLPDESDFPKGIEIVGIKGSFAEEYAKKYDMKFTEL
ncbi:MAG: leucine-rich repeat domain-containing protein [Erysipelotrichaceae bacterium]|nr:leucine-rich repeat domain-containing protein [Erysipelotrichaceae bacterium]